MYQEDVLNVMKDHDKKYVFSTGGDFDDKNLYPGIAIYHQGMDLVAVVSTGTAKRILERLGIQTSSSFVKI